jgi:hypothetical protein
MDNLDPFPGIDECIFCLGKVRPASRREVEARLRDADPAYRDAVNQQQGTWYICRACGPKSAVKWQDVSWDEEDEVDPGPLPQ